MASPGNVSRAQVPLESPPVVRAPILPSGGFGVGAGNGQPSVELNLELKARPVAVPPMKDAMISSNAAHPKMPPGVAKFLMPPEAKPEPRPEPSPEPNTIDIAKPATLAEIPAPSALPPALRRCDRAGARCAYFSTLATIVEKMPSLRPAVRHPEPLIPAQPESPEAPTVKFDDHATLQPPFLFEVAWEVCWQLGGIYTVLRTKAATTLRTWGDRYCLIGPYNPQTAPVEFEPEAPQGAVAEALKQLSDNGFPCHFGRWMIAGRPQVILLDYRAGFRDLDSNKYLMWADHGISINSNDGEMNEVVAFGFAVTEFSGFWPAS